MYDGYDRELVHWIDSHAENLIVLACDLVRIPSVTGNEGELAKLIAEWLSRNEFEFELSVVPEEFRRKFPDFSEERDLVARPNLYARLKAPGDSKYPPVVLNGHLDVVPVGDPARWRFAPFSGVRSDGSIWGRGAADMKGPIAAGLMAILALKECSAALSNDIEFQLVIGEETGGLGTIFALSDRPRPGAAIVLEPSQGRIVTAGAGSVQFTVRASGKAAHGCAPWEGRSALAMLLKCLGRLEAYAARRNASLSHPLFAAFPQQAPLNIGTFSAGEWRATVPESGQFSGRMGILPGEEITSIRREIEEEVARCRSDLKVEAHELSIDWPNVGFPAWATPHDAELIEALQSAARTLDSPGEPCGVMFGSDAGHFASLGIPVAIYGPGEIAKAHMVDEHVPERAVVDASKTLAIALARLATRQA
ncbi:M20 family metallopeptidase [Mesorhizobium sp. WSM4976]|nr:M20 family metallopeptidase [Mesorhizobium sp. WSM4976]MDG4898386.1 M20 family metallopeptidase [Mesorhizobium sp. WSM4976]